MSAMNEIRVRMRGTDERDDSAERMRKVVWSRGRCMQEGHSQWRRITLQSRRSDVNITGSPGPLSLIHADCCNL